MTDNDRGSLRHRVGRGALWSFLDVLLNRTSGFLLGIIVARLLLPADFGVYAVALVVHAVLINVSDLGVGYSLIRDDEATVRASGRTVTTIAWTTSALLGLLMVLTAPLVAHALDAPRAAGAIRVMAITLPLAGLTSVPGSLLRRNLQMKTFFVADSANNLVSGILVVSLAIAGAGPLALAWSFVGGQMLTTIILLARAPAWYWPGWNRHEAKRVLRFTTPLVGANLLGWVTQNADYVVVGKLMGSVSLGLYLLAFNMSGWPQNVLGSVIRSVSLPAFARLHEGGAEMEKALCGALKLVVRVMFPVCLFMGALAHPLVLFVYGERWAPAYAALVGLSINAATRVLLELLTDYLTAMGRTRAILVAQIIWLPALVVTLLLLVHWFGIAGAGAAQAAVCTGLILPIMVLNVHRAGANWLRVSRAVAPAFAWAVAVATLTWYVSTLIAEPFLSCMVAGAVGLSIYVLMYTQDLRRILRQVLERRSRTRQTLAGSTT